jgi:Dolichyl-phosphate-mannose-protein mannosyltransferase
MCSILKGVRRYQLEFLEWDRAIYIILATGLVLRILTLSLVAHVPLRNEAPGYMRMAAQLLHRQSFVPYWPPGVPYYLCVVQKLFGESILVARASILPIYLVFTAFLFLFVRRVATLRAANLAALIFVFYPPYVRDSFNPSTEYPAAACVMGIVLLMTWTGRKPVFSQAVLTGLVLGILILVRPSSLLLAAFVCFYLFKQSRSVRIALAPLAVVVILLSAWLWKAYSLTGRFVAINDSNSQNLFWGNNPYTPLYATWGEAQGELGISEGYRSLLTEIDREPPQVRNRLYRELALRYIVSQPGLFALRTFNRARAYFGFPVHYAEPLKNVSGERARMWASIAITVMDVLFYWTILALAIVFLFNSDNSSFAPDYRLALLGAAAAYALPYWVSMSQPRYNFPVVPLLAVPAVIFIDLLMQKRASDVLHPIIASARRRYAMLLVLAAFAYIQIEWIYMNYFRLRG